VHDTRRLTVASANAIDLCDGSDGKQDLNVSTRHACADDVAAAAGISQAVRSAVVNSSADWAAE